MLEKPQTERRADRWKRRLVPVFAAILPSAAARTAAVACGLFLRQEA
jgi:hypothetical protein